MRKTVLLLLTGALVLGACTTDEGAESTPTPEATQAAPTTGPADISAEDQAGDGTTITVDSVTLPTPGFVVIHADADGAPGAILGNSELLPEGESTDIVVTLDEALTESATVHPMAHVDANDNGVYEFAPPDETIDIPATFDDGSTAVVAVEITVE